MYVYCLTDPSDNSKEIFMSMDELIDYISKCLKGAEVLWCDGTFEPNKILGLNIERIHVNGTNSEEGKEN